MAGLRVRPAGPLRGEITVPGDKSITHRALLLGALADGTTEIAGALDGEDNDALAAFELDHFLVPVFRHPDARIGIEALLDGKFPEFKRRYPFD